MASIIAAGTTTTTALSYSADTSGVLQLQTNGTTPALTLDASQNATFAGKVASASSLQLATNGTTTAVTIDTNQNVGIGVTPSAWASDWKVMQIGSRSAFAQYNSNFSALVLNNVYFAGTGGSSPTYINTAAASFYQQVNGSHAWFNAPSGTAGNAITFTQAMTLDNSGNVQLGLTTNPQSSRLTVQGAASNIADFESTITTTSGGGIRVSNSGTTELWIGYYQFASAMGAGVTDAGLSARNNLLLDGTNAILFGQNGTEKGRFDSNGNLLVGTTTSYGSGGCLTGAFGSFGTGSVNARAVAWGQYSTNSGVPQYVGNWPSNGYWGLGPHSSSNDSILRFGVVSVVASSGVSWTGGYANIYAGAYTNASDYRIKENVANVADGVLAKVLALRVVNYNVIGIPDKDGDMPPVKDEVGFIAHEIQEQFPVLVTGKKDAVDGEGKPLHQGVDYAKLSAYLVKAIQELSAQVTTLQTQVTALKG